MGFIFSFIYFYIQVVRYKATFLLNDSRHSIILSEATMTIFYFSFKANLINYPEISWKITFAHPQRNERRNLQSCLLYFVYFRCSYLFWEYADKQIWTNFSCFMRISIFNIKAKMTSSGYVQLKINVRSIDRWTIYFH